MMHQLHGTLNSAYISLKYRLAETRSLDLIDGKVICAL